MNNSLAENTRELEKILCPENTYDIKRCDWKIGEKKCACYYINGYVDAGALQRILIFLAGKTEADFPEGEDITDLAERFLPCHDTKPVMSAEECAAEILRGSAVFLFDGFCRGVALDLRSFATRGITEPQKNRTIRGPHDGFNENLVANLVLIRRHLRTEKLRAERFAVGKKIPNEVVLLYLDGRAPEKMVERLRKKLRSTELSALSMTQETLANLLFPQKGLSVLNPFPRVRYTERPDVVSAVLMEGKIAVLCDNTPSVMLIPECIFDFFEEADDYYYPPVTATYLRLVRAVVFFASVFLVPVWLLFANHQEILPSGLGFVLVKDDFAVPLFWQLFIIELALDGLRMASLNTPDPLSNSFSVVGGLLLGDFAVKSGWFVPQTILYSALTAIANFVPTNYELGYSFKFMRITLLIFVQLFGVWGLAGGTLLWGAILFCTRSVSGKRALYPFFPFDGKAVLKILFKTTSGKEEKG